MNILSMNCPNCGASLDVNVAIKKAFCNYCGHDFMVDTGMDEIEKGNQALIEQIKGIMNPVNEYHRLLKEQKVYEKRVKEVEEKKKKNSMTGYFIYILLGALVPTLFLLGNTVLLILWWTVVIAGGLYGCYRYKEMQDEKLDRAWKREYEAYNEKEEAIQNLCKTTQWDFIPEQYRNAKALDYFCSVLQNKTAYTLDQAIRLFDEKNRHEEELHQKQMIIEEQKNMMKNMQNQSYSGQAKNSKNSVGDIVSTAATIGTIASVGAKIWKIKDDLF